MPFDAVPDDIAADYEVLEAVGALCDELADRLVRTGSPHKVIRRWLIGHRDPPEDIDDAINLIAMAVDLELHTPSMSGRTPVDRHLDAQRPQTDVDRQAFAALRSAQFHLIRILDRECDDLVRVRDLVTEKDLVLLNAHISPLAAGALTAMRLCPLASGRYVLISPLFMIDETMLASAMAFVRPGKALGHGHRCAASLYRDVARQTFSPMAEIDEREIDDMPMADLSSLSEVQYLALSWLQIDLLEETDRAEERAEVVAEVRRAASIDNLVDAFGWLGGRACEGPDQVRQAMTQIAELFMETIAQRARAGLSGCADALDLAAAQIAGHVASGAMNRASKDLFERARARLAPGGATLGGVHGEAARGSVDSAALDRVIQRIKALRAKTVDHGCTEQEAMAAAAKVAELLDRYDLSLDEVSVRQSDCAGIAVETQRRRRAPVDSCVQPVARFCDCRAWSEDSDSGALRYIFFGLKADVEAARFLHELIENTFETETAAFRKSEIYLGLKGGDRRTALNSFQIGLANGVAQKLDSLKTARRAATGVKTTGYDLVAVKQAVVEDELEKLGLRFTDQTTSRRRLVNADAYAAGKAAGIQFEPHKPLNR